MSSCRATNANLVFRLRAFLGTKGEKDTAAAMGMSPELLQRFAKFPHRLSVNAVRELYRRAATAKGVAVEALPELVPSLEQYPIAASVRPSRYEEEPADYEALLKGVKIPAKERALWRTFALSTHTPAARAPRPPEELVGLSKTASTASRELRAQPGVRRSAEDRGQRQSRKNLTPRPY